ncbi:DUF6765 family protein [Desulfosediminicola flagellatus]|uniref:DUF6765 family protein n=1 Tax=Desulfosediminicola flagellatus TaxID=2569541 RepID=UPI0012947893|nr:DUF6765 family protein [Desulfosediminicola flagellatus]
MQLDMHYYGTYAMARAAGLKKEVCRVIATAAQFVDDNAEKGSVEFRDGGRLDVEATAHHAFNIKNIDRADQRQIWVPFHFLPGNEGAGYTQRLTCIKDSEIAREMIDFNLSLLDQSYAIPLIGITAHVYADTFSHYGFSGVSSRENKVSDIRHYDVEPDMEKYITDKAKDFKNNYPESGLFQNIKSWFAEGLSGALGHGAVMTYPDRPYLKWDFIYETTEQRCTMRNNSETFLECCLKLHEMFQRVAREGNNLSDSNAFIDFSQIEPVIKRILNVQAPEQGRIDAWLNAAKEGELFGIGPEDIPLYNQHIWHNHRENLKREKDSRKAPAVPVFRYYQAAAIHRTNILRHLLPEKELIVA